MKIRLVIMMLCFGFLALSPVKASDSDIYHCRGVFTADGKVDASKLKSQVESCTEQQRDVLTKMRHALALGWKLAHNPGEIMNLVDFATIRSHERIGVSSGQMYARLGWMLRPDMNIWNTDAFSEMRARFADPSALRALWDSSKGHAIRLMKAGAIMGYVEQTYADVKTVFQKPIEVPVAAASPRWYDNQCWKPNNEDRRYQDSEKTCKELAWFPERFKQIYGVSPTANSSWALGFLFRRHMEGGTKLVTEYQAIGLEFGKMLETKG